MKKDHYDLDRIRAINLLDVLQHLQLEYRRDKKMRCPFHNEKTPSLQLHPTHFKCFGCGAGGDVIGFVEKYHGMEFQEAIAWLAHTFNISPSERPGLMPHKRSPRVEPAPQPLGLFDRDVQLEICENLTMALDVKTGDVCKLDPAHPVIPYAAERGWDVDVLYALADEWSLGVKGDGLVFCYRYGTKWRSDLHDSRSCRWLAGKGKDCIWRESTVEPSTETLHIFEGETDLIAAASCCSSMDGFIAAPGASWRPSTRQLNMGRGRLVRLCFDNDDAGLQATEVVGRAFSKVRNCAVEIFDWDEVPEGEDVGHLAKVLGEEKFQKAFDELWTEL